MFVLTPSLDAVEKQVITTRATHGHLIFEPELKTGLTITSSLPGIKSWVQPVAYDIRIEMFREKDNKKFTTASFYFVYQNRIETDSKQNNARKIRTAIASFIDSHDDDEEETWTLTQPIRGVWIPSSSEPGVDVRVDRDGSANIRTTR